MGADTDAGGMSGLGEYLKTEKYLPFALTHLYSSCHQVIRERRILSSQCFNNFFAAHRKFDLQTVRGDAG